MLWTSSWLYWVSVRVTKEDPDKKGKTMDHHLEQEPFLGAVRKLLVLKREW